MSNTIRGLRGPVIRALAKVGLVWALAVLGALFMGMSSQGQEQAGYSTSATHTDTQPSAFSVSTDGAPRTAGLALALALLGGGVTVLAIGAARGDRPPVRRYLVEPGPTTDPDLDPAPELSLSRGFGLVA
jgi:hypothetical protein